MRMRSLWLVSCGVALSLACAGRDGVDPVARDADFLARAQQQIAAREYRASENGEGLQAPNRAHNLRTYFERSGIRVHDRTAEDGAVLLRLSLAGIGREALAEPAS